MNSPDLFSANYVEDVLESPFFTDPDLDDYEVSLDLLDQPDTETPT